MRRLGLRMVRLEQRSLQGDVWGNHAQAWAEIMRRYATAHGGHMGDGEAVAVGIVLAEGGPPPALVELASVYRKGSTL